MTQQNILIHNTDRSAVSPVVWSWRVGEETNSFAWRQQEDLEPYLQLET